jgi:hypothetical protein
MQARLVLYKAVLAGPVLALLVVTFALTRRRILSYVRAASWRGPVSWWLVGVLPWILVALVGDFLIFGTTWYLRVLVYFLDVGLPFILFAPPFFAVGATVVWMVSRSRRIRESSTTPGGA